MRSARARASISATPSRARASPVRFNLREGSERDRNTAILSVGALGSGKTTLGSEAPVRGVPARRARDRLRPQGRPPFSPARRGRSARRDDRAAPRPGAARNARPAASRARAPAPGRRRLVPARPAAGSCRGGMGDGGRRSRRRGVAARARADLPGGRSRARARATRIERQVGEALAVYARSGLTQLGFADPEVALAPVGEHQVTYIPIRDLPAPEPGTPPLGVHAGRARRRADRAPDRDVRDAPARQRARRG